MLPFFLGNVIYFEVFGRPFVVLNALEDAKALLEKQSIIYSDRPRMVYIPEMCVLPRILDPLPSPRPSFSYTICLVPESGVPFFWIWGPNFNKEQTPSPGVFPN